ncbi:hypothetical protein BGW36DRAFT_383596 [Talaromyces proteolyticus]|uniref:Uncharacterized protein n=1 Tax=Talaromyces proteolyticus TaxID=1131652 RepID=A0AAD4KKR7_9EURO|nr:uncharacterized protein BGW36DRAFT_383596 [Talaromyces proteolyticus]KAH8693733.1 hypothetical protein BGW36DRAFT_383596 [Talaromyces proteolyticus]
MRFLAFLALVLILHKVPGWPADPPLEGRLWLWGSDSGLQEEQGRLIRLTGPSTLSPDNYESKLCQGHAVTLRYAP